MTDKKKLDEAVTLTMNGDQGEVQMTSTIQANDLVELAMLLKNSGIVADDFQGPATITQDDAGISTTASAANLRAIMNMLEPVFQAAGDIEGDMAADMAEPECDQAIAPEMDAVEIEPEMELDPVDPGMGPDDFSPDKEMAVEPEMEPEMELEAAPATLDENQDDDAFDTLDWITTNGALSAAEGSEDIEINEHDVVFSWVRLPDDFEGHEVPEEVMAKLHQLGVSQLGPDLEDFGIYVNPDNGVKVAYAWYYLDTDMNEDAEYDYRTHDVHPHEYEGMGSKEVVQAPVKPIPARSGDNPMIEGTKTFKDYVKEAELNELGSNTIKNYVKKVNDVTGDDTDDETARKRGRGLSNAQNKIHWKDAKVLATENTFEGLMSQLGDYLGEDLSIKKMGNHEITFSDPADDEIEDLESDSPEKLAQVTKDISADMHEDGEMRRMPPRPTDYNSVAKRAREDSKNGYVQHVDRHEDGGHSVSDWMSDNTVGSFANGRHVGGQDIDEEEQLDELSDATKDSYFSKAAKQADHHARMMDMHDELGNQDMVDKHHAHIKKRVAGMQASLKGYQRPGAEAPEVTESETRFEITGSVCDYQILDTKTGEVVATDIRSGTMAHEMCIWYEKEAANADTGADVEVDESEVDEAIRGSAAWRADLDRKNEQYGPTFFLNTDCGYASLEDIMAGHSYFDASRGFTILEIDRNGKKGFNYLSGVDGGTSAGSSVTCVTQTSTGQKFRPGKVVATVTGDELNDYDGVVKKLAAYGITPSKKLSVKTFD